VESIVADGPNNIEVTKKDNVYTIAFVNALGEQMILTLLAVQMSIF